MSCTISISPYNYTPCNSTWTCISNFQNYQILWIQWNIQCRIEGGTANKLQSHWTLMMIIMIMVNNDKTLAEAWIAWVKGTMYFTYVQNYITIIQNGYLHCTFDPQGDLLRHFSTKTDKKPKFQNKSNSIVLVV